MIFIISLVLAALFIWGCAKPLRQHPAPFYAAAAAIALAVFGCTVGGVTFPGWFQNWIWPLFSRSAFATALWAAVMWTGALPNGSKAIKILMPVRGELSILACILTLGHNAAYGRTYFRFLFTQPARLPASTRAAAVCSLVMICIMLPLFVTSFKSVRRRMKGGSWKRLQRLAYGFYALLYVHILLLYIPYALAGRSGGLTNVLVYSVVFLGYGVCRVLKARAVKTKRSDRLRRWQTAAVAGALAVSLCLTGALGLSAGAKEPVLEEPSARQSAPAPVEAPESETPESETPALPETPDPVQLDESEPSDALEEPAEPADQQTQAPEQTEQPERPAETPAQAETPAPAETSVPAGSAVQSAPPQETPAQEPPTQSAVPAPEPSDALEEPVEPADQQPEEPEPVRMYQNGAFSGTGQGFEGPITVSVTIQDDVITDISITSAMDDEPYFSDGKTVVSRILAAQSANVDTISGATYSSGGIIDAVAAALDSAKN